MIRPDSFVSHGMQRSVNACGERGFMMRSLNSVHDSQAQVRSGVVLAHDWLVGLRGGEWVLDRLARLFGPTDLYTLVMMPLPHHAVKQASVS